MAATSIPPAQPDGDETPQGGFEWLSTRTQIARLRRAALDALAEYDLPSPRLRLLVHLFNTTFTVDTADGQRYALRIHRAANPDVLRVEGELTWLAALRRDTLLQVPDPVRTRAGRLYSLVTDPEALGLPNPTICVLFRWLPGRHLRKGLTPAHHERVGEAMAHLHNHAAVWARQSSYPLYRARGRVDWPLESARGMDDPFAPEVLAEAGTLVAENLSDKDAAQVVDMLEKVRDAERSLGIKGQAKWKEGNSDPDKTTFGLIHADMHYNNVLFERGSIRVIDFDDCGFGPLLYDHAVILNALRWLKLPDTASLREGLLRGYRRVHTLTAEHEEMIDTFVALRRIQDGLWVLHQRKHPAIGEDWTAQARTVLGLKD